MRLDGTGWLLDPGADAALATLGAADAGARRIVRDVWRSCMETMNFHHFHIRDPRPQAWSRHRTTV